MTPYPPPQFPTYQAKTHGSNITSWCIEVEVNITWMKRVQGYLFDSLPQLHITIPLLRQTGGRNAMQRIK